MISYIKGLYRERLGDTIVVESGSMGFNIRVPLSVLQALPRLGEEITVYTYLQVREDAMNLYGFLCRQDLNMFKQLIGVNGVGPKGALGILSVLDPDQLRLAIISADAKTISKAPGIGSKTAQRVILDLKDQIQPEDILPLGDLSGDEAEPVTADAGQQAVQALVALGYTTQEASKAVRAVQITEQMTVEQVLKDSLKHLSFL